MDITPYKKSPFNNPFFQDFIGIMQNDEFDAFYKKYFQSWSDIQTMVFYMKLYKAVEYGYEEQYERPIEKEFMVFVLHRIMTTQELRKEAMTIFRNLKENDALSDKAFFCKLLDFQALQSERTIMDKSRKEIAYSS
jgi:hypothetical protein